MKNIYLFTGEEKYLLQEELERRKSNFSQKFGQDSVFSFDTEHFEAHKIMELLLAGGLFSDKKLVIVQGVPVDTDPDNKLSSKELDHFMDVFLSRDGILPQSVLVIFVSFKPDKRTKFYKFLQSNAQIKEFKPLSGVQLKLFVKDHLSGLKIEDTVLEYFLMKVGKNLHVIAQEIEKLKYFVKARNLEKVDVQTIDLITYGQVEVNAFLFLDYLLPSPPKAVEVLNNIHNNGGDEYQTLGMVYRGLRLYIYLLDLYEQGIRDNKTLAQMTKHAPFAVSKAMKNIDLMQQNKQKIHAMFRQLVELDFAVKSGKLPVSGFWLELKKIIYVR